MYTNYFELELICFWGLCWIKPQRRISEHSRNEHRLCTHQLIHRSAESSHKDVSLSTAEMSTDCAHISRSTTTTCLGFFFEHGFSCSSTQSVNMLISFWSIISSGFEFWKSPPDFCRCMTNGQSLEHNLVKAFDIESTGTSSPPPSADHWPFRMRPCKSFSNAWWWIRLSVWSSKAQREWEHLHFFGTSNAD